jgi:hypothetical protein
MESEYKSKSDNETKKSHEVMTLAEKLKILDKLHGDMSSAAVGPAFHLYYL